MQRKSGPARGQYARPALERFWSKVEKRGPEDCWPWRGKPDAWGYGRFQESVAGGIGGWRSSLAHRVSWSLANGPIPDGLVVRHACDNPPCVNPAHLLIGTAGDNARDRDIRGRTRSGRGERHGHAKLTEAQVREIRALHHVVTKPELAQRYGVSVSLIGFIFARTLWKDVA